MAVRMLAKAPLFGSMEPPDAAALDALACEASGNLFDLARASSSSCSGCHVLVWEEVDLKL